MLEEEGQVNAFHGSVHRNKDGGESQHVYDFRGLVGRHGDIYPPGDPATARRFFDMTKFHTPHISYLPEAHQLPFESMSVWRGSNLAILRNDIVGADTEKKKVEADNASASASSSRMGKWSRAATS